MSKDGSFRLGVIMLDTRFPRPVGDIGNPATFPFEVMYQTVQGASPDKVVLQNAPGLTRPFIDAALLLEGQGVDLIVTSCGFLASHQQVLAQAVDVPVVTSSLLQVQVLERTLGGGRRAAIFTIDPPSLTKERLRAALVPSDTEVFGTDPESHFNRSILGDRADMDLEQARQDVLDAVAFWLKDRPDSAPRIGAIVLECTNLAPYAEEISSMTGLPVWSLNTMIEGFAAARFPQVLGDGGA